MSNGYGGARASGLRKGQIAASQQRFSDTSDKISHSRSMWQERAKQGLETVQAVSSAVELGSSLWGGWQDKKKFDASKTHVQERMAERAYMSEKAEGEGDWKDLTDEQRKGYTDKFTPTAKEQSWGEWAMGEDKKWSFGKDSEDFYSKGDISAAGKYGEVSKLDKLLGYNVSGLFSNQGSGSDSKPSMKEEVEYPRGEGTVLKNPEQKIEGVHTGDFMLEEDNVDPFTGMPKW